MTKKEETMEERIFDGFLILNYKTKHMRVVVKLPRSIKPFEIPIRFNVKLKMPKMPEIVAKGEFEIPPVKVKEMFLDSI